MKHEEYDTILTDSELPYEARLIYVYLRRHMDYVTGIVGADGGLSYRYIWMYALEHKPRARSNEVAPKFSKDKMKRWIARLVESGYIVPMHSGKLREAMIFFLPFGAPSTSPSAGSAPHARHSTPPLGITPKSSFKTMSSDREKPDARHSEKPDARHISVNTEYMNTHKYFGIESPIPADWVPDDLLIRELQREFQLPEQLLREQGVMFRMRAKERGFLRKSWRDGFRLWVKRGVESGFAEYHKFLND